MRLTEMQTKYLRRADELGYLTPKTKGQARTVVALVERGLMRPVDDDPEAYELTDAGIAKLKGA